MVHESLRRPNADGLLYSTTAATALIDLNAEVGVGYVRHDSEARLLQRVPRENDVVGGGGCYPTDPFRVPDPPLVQRCLFAHPVPTRYLAAAGAPGGAYSLPHLAMGGRSARESGHQSHFRFVVPRFPAQLMLQSLRYGTPQALHVHACVCFFAISMRIVDGK